MSNFLSKYFYFGNKKDYLTNLHSLGYCSIIRDYIKISFTKKCMMLLKKYNTKIIEIIIKTKMIAVIIDKLYFCITNSAHV